MPSRADEGPASTALLPLALLAVGASLRAQSDTWRSLVRQVGQARELAERERRADRALAAARTRSQKHESYLLRGSVRMERREHERALADYRAALALDEDALDAWLGRGAAELALERLAEARTSFARGLRLDARSRGALYGTGEAWRRERAYRKARPYYTRALRVTPRDVASLYGRALCELGLDDPVAAWLETRRALAIDPAHAPTQRLRAAMTEGGGRMRAHLFDLHADTRATPTDMAAWRKLTEFYLDILQFESAADAATQWRDAAPDELEAQRARALALFGARSFAAAAAQLRHVLRRAPSDHFSALLRHRALVEMGLAVIAKRDLELHLERAAGRGESTWRMLLGYLLTGAEVEDEQKRALRAREPSAARVQDLELEFFAGPARRRGVREAREFRAELAKTRAQSPIARLLDAARLSTARKLDSLGDWVDALPDGTSTTLPAGVFRSEGIPLHIHERHGLVLRGATSGGGTRIVQVANTSVAPALVISKSSSIELRDLRVQRVGAARRKGQLLVCSDSQQLRVRGCEFASGDVGLQIHACRDVEVSLTTIRDCAGAPLDLDAVRGLKLRALELRKVGAACAARNVRGPIVLEDLRLDGAPWTPPALRARR